MLIKRSFNITIESVNEDLKDIKESDVEDAIMDELLFNMFDISGNIKVIEIKKDSHALFQEVLINPRVDFTKLEEVFVVKKP